MRFVSLIGLSALTAFGCGPAVANTSGGTDGGPTGGSDSTGSGSSGGPSSTSSDDEPSTSATSDGSSGGSSTGDPDDAGLCWSSEWTDASGITGIWTDDTQVLAAAQTSIVTFDGDDWNQLPLEDPLVGAGLVAANSFDDAWFGSSRSSGLTHLQGQRIATVDLPLEEIELLSLEVDADGEPWVVVRPDPPCLGLCRAEIAQLFHRDGDEWVEPTNGEGLLDIDIVGETMWVSGEQGLVGFGAPGEAWTLIEPPAVADFDEVHGVSATEAWVVAGGAYWHYVDGLWSEGSTSPNSGRSFGLDADGEGWWITKDLSADDSRLERVGEGGLTFVTSVPDTRNHILTGGDALLGGRDGGNYIFRVTDLDGAATVSTDYGQVDIGGFGQIFVPSAGEVVGGGSFGGSGLQRHRDGAWSRIEAGPSQTFSIWGPSASLFFAVDFTTGLLWQVTDGATGVVGLPIADPRLARVWGAAEDSVFVCGAPPAEGSGQLDELSVLRWNGAQWADISPEDVGNIGGPSSLDMHGVGEHLYVKTALRLYHYDGSSWDSVAAPDLGTELRSVRAYAPDRVFVVNRDDVLLMHDGLAWETATNAWPELVGLEGARLSLTGTAEAGIYLSVYPTEDDAVDSLWRFGGEGWEPVELPEQLGSGARFGVAESGGELWADDGRRIWTATGCE